MEYHLIENNSEREIIDIIRDSTPFFKFKFYLFFKQIEQIRKLFQ
jgi:hypothetical protein